MARRKGIIGLALQEVERRYDVAVIPADDRRLAEQAMTDLRVAYRDQELMGYGILDYMGGQPSEVRPENRRAMSQQSRMMWITDPQAYRAVETMVDFAFGRGIPKPRAKWGPVQRVLDDFWADPVNKTLISSAEGQRKMGRDLIIQSNLFPLIFDDGDDGKVKVGILAHDSVEDVVRDDENRLLILYYTAKDRAMKWDYEKDRYVQDTKAKTKKVTYYEHYANVQALKDDDIKVPAPAKDRLGDGKVYHLVENTTTEMAFGVPTLYRTHRWLTGYNDFMSARVDMMRAAAAFIMKRKIKGTPTQLMKMASRSISRQSPLASGMDSGMYPVAGRAAGIINENEMVDHEPFKVDTGSANAAQDGDMLHGQIAAGTGIPKHYLGNSDANLATATALELPVLKRVEAFQEVFESFYRTLFDAVIQRAADAGLLAKYAAEEEEEGSEADKLFAEIYDTYMAALTADEDVTEAEVERAKAILLRLQEDYEDQSQDEADSNQDLSYEFSMPSPLRRMMSDLVTAAQVTAQTFDPNNTNIGLSRTLLAIVLGEAFEVDDPAGLVEEIYPPGYVDPMLQMAQQQGPGGGGQPPGGEQGPETPGWQGGFSDAAEQPAGAGQSYGAKMQSTAPESVPGAPQEGARTLRRRDGDPVRLGEARRTLDEEPLAVAVRGRARALDHVFDVEVAGRTADELERAVAVSSNGDGPDS